MDEQTVGRVKLKNLVFPLPKLKPGTCAHHAAAIHGNTSQTIELSSAPLEYVLRAELDTSRLDLCVWSRDRQLPMETMLCQPTGENKKKIC